MHYTYRKEIPFSSLGFSFKSKISASRSIISTSRATWTAVRGLSPVIMIHCSKNRMSSSIITNFIRSTNSVWRIRKHLQRLNSIALQWTMEYQETGEDKVRLNLVPWKLVDLQHPQKVSTVTMNRVERDQNKPSPLPCLQFPYTQERGLCFPASYTVYTPYHKTRAQSSTCLWSSQGHLWPQWVFYR